MDIVILSGFAFLAGFVDAVAGGGGLIQLPALLIFLPQASASNLAAVFGTNKFSSLCGTSMAVVQYSRRVKLNWGRILPACGAAFVFSFLGARAVSLINTGVLKPVVLTLLVLVAVYVFLQKNLGGLHAPQFTPSKEKILGMLVGAAIGFYDGFFGPGTGSFLMFIFIGMFGFDFLHASASAKAVNFATNLSAVAYFAATGNVLYQFACPMAACNILGAFVGSRMAILKGNRFIRGLFLLMTAAMILRFAAEVF